MVSFPRIPTGFLPCDGSLQQIADYDVLYNLLGTTYGGDGQTTFGLPDLRGRVIVNQGQGSQLSNYFLGQQAGVEAVILNAAHNPPHAHLFLGSNDSPNQAGPGNAFPANTGDSNPFYTSDANALTPLGGGSIAAVGGQPHENRMPLLVINFIIASAGIYPSQP